jgi:transcriptional regulator with XRE-family HTH domain
MNKKLKEVRMNKGLSQSKLADLAGINVRTLQHYEQGSKNFDHARLDTIFSVCNALECKLSEIITDENYIEIIGKYEDRI